MVEVGNYSLLHGKCAKKNLSVEHFFFHSSFAYTMTLSNLFMVSKESWHMSPANANHLHSQDHRSLCVELFVASIPFLSCLGAILMLGHRDLYKIKKTFLLNTYPHKALGAHDKKKKCMRKEKKEQRKKY